nr:uncharacterized protein LOC127303934 [Lolium perenne]
MGGQGGRGGERPSVAREGAAANGGQGGCGGEGAAANGGRGEASGGGAARRKGARRTAVWLSSGGGVAPPAVASRAMYWPASRATAAAFGARRDEDGESKNRKKMKWAHGA